MLINLVLLGVTVGSSWALPEARLLGQSKSGQTALFNLGIHDGVKEGEFAVIVKEIRHLDTRDLRLIPIAKAKNVKISTQNSVWVLYHIFDPELLVKGDPYLILSESAMLSGRRDPRMGRISVITEKDKRSFQVQSTLQEGKDQIAKLKNQYPEISPLHEREMRSDADGELIDVEGWNSYKDTKSRTALYKSPHQKDFQRNLRLNTFEKLVTGYLRKVNDPKFSYDSFYDEQMKEEFMNEFKKRSNFETEYEKFVTRESMKSTSDAKFYRSLLEKGESWSEDFSDEEVRSVLGQVSVLQEKDRRRVIMSNNNRYTAYLSLGLPLNETQTQEDAGYRRDGRYAVDVDFEATPFLKHEMLEKFTLNTSLRMNKTATEFGRYNASVDETSVTAGMNWYPIYSPYVVQAPVIFLGTYIRSGVATMHSPTANEKASYTVLSLPGFRGGLKYNFRNNFGLRMALSLEKMSLDRYEQSKLGSILPDQSTLAEGKLNFGLAYSF